jgi:hypothetical protein
MNIVITDSYEGGYTCPICQEPFKDNEIILMIKHHNKPKEKRPEKIAVSYKRKHIFHNTCISQYIESIKHREGDILCPLDREPIHSVIKVNYYDIAILNIINFSHDYYELIDKCEHNENMYISIIDQININCKDVNGKTIFYCACQRGNLKLIKNLVKFGCSPIISDDQGFTPLMVAVCQGHYKIVKYLLTLTEVVMDLNHVDNSGKTALEYAKEFGKYQCMRKLLTVPGHSNIVLNKIFNSVQYINKTDPMYDLQLVEIIKQLRKMLGLRSHKKPKMCVTLCPHKPPHVRVNNQPKQKVLDIVNPDLIDLIYKPQEQYTNNLPLCDDDEIESTI